MRLAMWRQFANNLTQGLSAGPASVALRRKQGDPVGAGASGAECDVSLPKLPGCEMFVCVFSAACCGMLLGVGPSRFMAGGR